MLKLFKPNETNFDHNETILKDVVSAEVFEESNGEFSLTIEYPAKLNLEAGQIIEAPTPRGLQLFRIVKPTRVIGQRDYFRAYCRHIFYDLLDNFIEDTRPTNKSAGGALTDILNGTQYPHRFTGTSDISAINTAYYIRKNPVEAIMGSGNSILGLWGGHIVRDNFEITIKEQSLDRGYEVRFGKNLIGLDEEVDATEVATRIYPTAVINEPVVTTLPEKYIDSPLIDTYPEPVIRELRVELDDTQKALPLSSIYTIMRQKAQEQFTLGADKPLVNYKVNFLHYTNDNAKILKQLDLNDTIRVVIDKYGINLSAKVIKYTYDSIKEKYLSMELGNFKESLANQRVEIGQIIDEINKTISDNNVSIADKMKAIGDMISGNNGGYKIDRFNDLGQPYETLYMDSPNLNTAVNVIRLNQAGIGFSTSGYNGPFNTAITIDGKIMGQYIVVSALDAISANLGTMTLGTLKNTSETWYLNLETGQFFFQDGVTTLNGDGINIKTDGIGVNNQISATGQRIADNVTGNDVAKYDQDGAKMDTLEVKRVTSPHVANKVGRTKNYYVYSTATGDGSGRDEFNRASSVQDALRSALDDAIVIENNAQININISGAINEDISINGISGHGRINILGAYGSTRVAGSAYIRNTTCPVYINGVTFVSVAEGGQLVYAGGLCNVTCESVRIDGANQSRGFRAEDGAIIRVETSPVVNCTAAYFADYMSTIYTYDTYGQGNAVVADARKMSRIGLHYRHPSGTVASQSYNGGEVQEQGTATGSSFSYTPPDWSTISKTFVAELETANASSGYVWRTGTWTQGSWDGQAHKGTADFGTRIKDFLEGSGGFQNISNVIIKARRNRSSGRSNPVSLKVTSPTTLTLPAVTLGATSVANANASIISAMQSGSLKLQSSTTSSSDYAGFDRIEITVSVQKKI